MSLLLHKTERMSATEPVAQWLGSVLNPAIQAANFSHPPPVELRPTGTVGGWCAGREYAPDRRIAITKKIIFWNKESIISTYLHEAAHRLLDTSEVANHGAEFFLLDLILHLRCQSLFSADAVQKVDFYDLQDCPTELENEPAWRGIVTAWALPKAEQIIAAHGDKTAEELVPIVLKSWAEFLVVRRKSAQQAAQRAQQIVSQAEQIKSLKSDRNFWGFLSLLLFIFAAGLSAKLLEGR